jgi:hypothetical protein
VQGDIEIAGHDADDGRRTPSISAVEPTTAGLPPGVDRGLCL